MRGTRAGTVFALCERGATMNSWMSMLASVQFPTTLTAVDCVVLGLVLLSMALGFWTGFVWQFVRIAQLVISVWVSWLYYPTVAKYLGASVPDAVRNVVAAAAIFVAVMVICYLVSFFFHGVIDALKPEMPDRLLGAVFGLIKGVMFAGFLAFMLIRFLPVGSEARTRVEGSKGAMAAATCVQAVLNILPIHSDEETQAAKSTRHAGHSVTM